MLNKDTNRERMIKELDYLQKRILAKDGSDEINEVVDNTQCFPLIDYIPVEIVIVDQDGIIIAYNLTKERSGRRLPCIGDRMYIDYARKHKINMHEILMNCINTGEIRTFSEQQYDNHYLSITITPFPLGAIITSQDITKRKEAEQALKKSEQEKAIILSSMSEMLTYHNKDLLVLWANGAAGQSVNQTPEQLVGRYCYDIWYNRSSLCPNCPMQRVLKTGQFYQAEKEYKDGKIWLIRGYPVRDDNDKVVGVVSVTLDISKRKHAEGEKEKIQGQLIQSQKMEAIGTLAGGVAHDFNNLLTAIGGTLDMVMMKVDSDDTLYSDLKEIQDSANRAADLTRQLLIFSRKHPIRFSPCNLNDVIADMLKMLHRLIGEDIGISTALESNLWKIMADKGSLEQIVVNLCVNARDAMPKGGNLTIKTANVDINHSYCKVIPDARPGRFVRLTISDSGKGMDKKTVQHIFEPFYTTKSMSEGTGLGLSVVYGIVKQHEGWINVYSEPGEGTEFKIYLSAEGVHEEDEGHTEIPLSELQGIGENVLIVEDETCVREFVHRALTKNGYQVVSVESYKKAERLFEEHEFDLVLSDVVLPDGNGLDLIESFLKQKPEIKIMLSSGYTDKKSQWAKIQEKGYPFLQKPYALFNLLVVVKEVMEKK